MNYKGINIEKKWKFSNEGPVWLKDKMNLMNFQFHVFMDQTFKMHFSLWKEFPDWLS